MASDLSVRMIMLEARYGERLSLGEAWEEGLCVVQDRHQGHREMYCKQEREETLASGKGQRRCLEGGFENGGKGRGCYRSKGLR